jgi:hypothetical protein
MGKASAMKKTKTTPTTSVIRPRRKKSGRETGKGDQSNVAHAVGNDEPEEIASFATFTEWTSEEDERLYSGL